MRILYIVFAECMQSLATLDVFSPMIYLAKHGHLVYIVCCNDGSNPRVLNKGGNLTVYPQLPPIQRRKHLFDEALLYFLLIPEVVRLTELIKRVRPDVILCDSSYSLPVLGYLLSKLYKIPIIIIHRELLLESMYYFGKTNTFFKLAIFGLMKLNHSIFKRIVWNVAISNSIAYFLNYFCQLKKKIDVINLLCLDTKEVSLDPKEVMVRYSPLKTDEHTCTILYAGSLDPIRRIDQLINAFVDINKQYPDTKLIIVGKTTTSQNSVLKKIDSLSVENKASIYFLGFLPRKDVLALIAASDICVEPYPKTVWTPSGKLIEYMTLGKCCIASDTLPNRLIIQHGVTGLLLEKNNADDLKTKLLQAISSTEFRERLGKNASLFAKKHFDFEEIGQIFEQYIVEALLSTR